MAYKSITVSGLSATGTTTTAKALCEKLGLEYHSAGEFFRKYMLEHNIPLHAHLQIPDELDREIDEKLTSLAQKGGVVVEGRYIGYFTKDMDYVLRVLLTADEKTRLQRAMHRTHTHTETVEEIQKREEENDRKFRKIYANENFLDPKFFNLVINTASTAPDNVISEIVEQFSQQ